MALKMADLRNKIELVAEKNQVEVDYFQSLEEGHHHQKTKQLKTDNQKMINQFL